MRTMNKKRLAAVAGGTAIVMAGAGIGYAYWTTSGTGNGSATTADGNATAFSVAGGAASDMFPGDEAQTVTATVTNVGDESYKLQTLSAYLTIDEPHATAGCSASDYLLNGVDAPGTAGMAANLHVAPTELAKRATTEKTFTLQFHDKSTEQDSCKGASVTVNYIAG
jgi:hypothetical protein